MGTMYWDCQDDSSNSNASELEYINRPLILKVKLPFTDYLSFLNYVRFLRACKFLGRYDPIENRVSDTRSTFHRTSSWYDNPKFSDFVTERRYRRSRSVYDLYDLVVEYASSVAFISRSARSEARAVAPTSMLPSGSSTSIASSYQSKASLRPSVSKGLLRCEQNNGSLDISFSEDDNPVELYSATSHKIGSSSADYTYIFLSQTGEFIGKMNVFTSIVLRPDHTRRTETEFVLCGAGEDRWKEVQSTKQKGFSEKVMDIFRPNRKPNPQISCIDEAGDNLCILEVAAIVVESAHRDGKKEAVGGSSFLRKFPQSTRIRLHGHIYMAASETREHIDSMTSTSEGLYTLHFQRSLTPLQAFAVGAAIIHTQTAALCDQL